MFFNELETATVCKVNKRKSYVFFYELETATVCKVNKQKNYVFFSMN